MFRNLAMLDFRSTDNYSEVLINLLIDRRMGPVNPCPNISVHRAIVL